MKVTALALAASALLTQVSAHYIFEYLDSNAQYQYIRKSQPIQMHSQSDGAPREEHELQFACHGSDQ